MRLAPLIPVGQCESETQVFGAFCRRGIEMKKLLFLIAGCITSTSFAECPLKIPSDDPLIIDFNGDGNHQLKWGRNFETKKNGQSEQDDILLSEGKVRTNDKTNDHPLLRNINGNFVIGDKDRTGEYCQIALSKEDPKRPPIHFKTGQSLKFIAEMGCLVNVEVASKQVVFNGHFRGTVDVTPLAGAKAEANEMIFVVTCYGDRRKDNENNGNYVKSALQNAFGNIANVHVPPQSQNRTISASGNAALNQSSSTSPNRSLLSEWWDKAVNYFKQGPVSKGN